MTDEQIVKALVQCASEEYCSGCSMLGRASVGYECMKKVMKDAADLIKRQQAEIEELKKVGNKIDSLGAVAALTDQRERLIRAKNEWEREVRAEAVREFAEKYKTEVTNRYEDIAYKDLFFGVIDNLVKEMTEEK